MSPVGIVFSVILVPSFKLVYHPKNGVVPFVGVGRDPTFSPLTTSFVVGDTVPPFGLNVTTYGELSSCFVCSIGISITGFITSGFEGNVVASLSNSILNLYFFDWPASITWLLGTSVPLAVVKLYFIYEGNVFIFVVPSAS